MEKWLEQYNLKKHHEEILTIVLSELKLDSEQVPNNLSWHFLCTAVWQAKMVIKNKNHSKQREKKK